MREVIEALVEFVVSHRGNVEAHRVESVDRRLVLRHEALEGRGSDQVARRRKDRGRVFRSERIYGATEDSRSGVAREGIGKKPAVEVIDSRYKDFKFDLKSVIADNSSSCRFVTGGRMADIADVDLKNIGVVMEINGEVVQTGAGAAVLGHPASSVAMLANMLADRGESLPAGSFIMIGAITAAVEVKKGDAFTVRYQGLGSLSGKFV